MSSKNFKFTCKKSKKQIVQNIPDIDNIITDSTNLPRIRVCVRKRPPNKKEIQNSDIDILEIRNGNSLTVKELK